jgi:hypothetical protein
LIENTKFFKVRSSSSRALAYGERYRDQCQTLPGHDSIAVSTLVAETNLILKGIQVIKIATTRKTVDEET